MTNPLPPISFGNTASELSSAGANFAMGMKKEREARRQQAMEEALLAVQQREAEARMQRAMQGPAPVTRTAIVNGRLRNVQIMQDGSSRVVEGPGEMAPESQYFGTAEEIGTGRRLPYGQSRYVPGSPAYGLDLPEGMQGVTQPGSIQQIEDPVHGNILARIDPRFGTSQPVTNQSGQPVVPGATAQEISSAGFAVNMERAAQGMENVANRPVTPGRTSPVEEAVTFLGTQAVLQALPAIGAPAGEVFQRAMGLGMTQEAAEWLAHWYTFIAFAVPLYSGKQMTVQEMRQQTAKYIPMVGESPFMHEMKRRKIREEVELAKRMSGPGMTRVGGNTPPPNPAPAGRPNRFFGNNRARFSTSSTPQGTP